MEDRETRNIKDRIDGPTRITFDHDMVDKVFQAPTVRDLPKYAEMYGLYSTFIAGNEKMFFVYGFDKKMIHEEPVVEANGWIYPECELERYGYQDSDSLLRKSWNVAVLNGDIMDYSYIANGMAALEMLRDRYRLHNIEMPEFIFFPRGYYEQFETFINVIDNKSLKDNSGKRAYYDQETYFLNGIAIPEWPISPKNRTPGIMAFVGISGFCPDKYRDVEKVYRDKSSWQKTFEQCCRPLYVYNDMDRKSAKYIMECMDKYGYPYKVGPTDSRLDRQNLHEQQVLAKMFSEQTGNVYSARETGVTFSIYTEHVGYVDYLIDKMTSKANGGKASKMFDALLGKTDEEPECPGYYIFGLPQYMKEDFDIYAKEMNIEYEYAPDYYKETTSQMGSYYITPVYNAAPVEVFIQQYTNDRFSEHIGSCSHDAPMEIRTRSINGITSYIKRHPWHYYGGKINEVDVNGNLTGRSFSAEEELDCALNYPIAALEEEGYYQDNEK